MKQLIINADDFGLTPGVDRGILEAMERGVVTSTSALVFEEKPEIPAAIHDRVGIHLRLTDGPPAGYRPSIPTLLADDGLFPRHRDGIRADRINPAHIRREWARQIALFLMATGGRCTHLDTHHHVTTIEPVWEIFLEMAEGMRVPAVGVTPAQRRQLGEAGIRCPDSVLPFPPTDAGRVADLANGEFAAGCSTVWVYAHPGYVDPELATRSYVVQERERELERLLDPALRAQLTRNGVQLVGAAAL